MAASYPSRPRRRANGEGSIYPYKGRWRGALTWTSADGTQRRRIVSPKSQAEVRRALAAMRAELDRGQAPPATSTVGGFLAGWLDASWQRVRPATWRQSEFWRAASGTHRVGGVAAPAVARETRWPGVGV